MYYCFEHNSAPAPPHHYPQVTATLLCTQVTRTPHTEKRTPHAPFHAILHLYRREPISAKQMRCMYRKVLRNNGVMEPKIRNVWYYLIDLWSAESSLAIRNILLFNHIFMAESERESVDLKNWIQLPILFTIIGIIAVVHRIYWHASLVLYI